MRMECVVCKRFCQTSCASCKLVHYCSIEHQRQHWNAHRFECLPFKIVDDPENLLGKQWVATRDLKPGQILLDEKPLLVAPKFHTQDPFCVTCGFSFQKRKPKLCSKCQWPVCGPACERNPVHAKNECLFFVANNVLYSDLYSFPIGKQLLVTMIRGAGLKNENMRAFRQLVSLQHSSRDEEFKKHQAMLFLMLHVALQSMTTKLSALQSWDIFTVVAKVALINGFGKEYKGSSGDTSGGLGNGAIDYMLEGVGPLEVNPSKQNIYIYNKSSRLNHSCYPNCSWTIRPEPSGKIRIRASVPIKKGEPLTISYGNENAYNLLFIGTMERRQLLRATCGIDCKCVRCIDPTEMGNFSSAIACHGCVGYHVPNNPFDLRDDAPWKCTRCDHAFILYEVQEIHSYVREHLKLKIETSKDPLGTFLKGIEENCFENVHPGHWMIGEAIELISNILRDEVTGIKDSDVNSECPSVDVLDRHIEWARHGLALSNCICPGINLYRAKQLLWLSYLLRLKLLNHAQTMMKEDLQSDFLLFVETSDNAVLFFKGDFCRNGEKLNYIAQGIRKAVEKVKNSVELLIDTDVDDVDCTSIASLSL